MGINDLLSVKEWSPAHAAEVTYTTSPAQESPPTTPNDSNGAHQPGLAWRFARVEAHSGDLLVRVVKAGGTAPTMGTGDYRVYQGSAETFQVADGTTIYVAGVSGSTTGAVIWGR